MRERSHRLDQPSEDVWDAIIELGKLFRGREAYLVVPMLAEAKAEIEASRAASQRMEHASSERHIVRSEN